MKWFWPSETSCIQASSSGLLRSERRASTISLSWWVAIFRRAFNCDARHSKVFVLPPSKVDLSSSTAASTSAVAIFRRKLENPLVIVYIYVESVCDLSKVVVGFGLFYAILISLFKYRIIFRGIWFVKTKEEEAFNVRNPWFLLDLWLRNLDPWLIC